MEEINVPVDPRIDRDSLKEPAKRGEFDIYDTLTEDEIRDCTVKALDTVKKSHNMALSLEKSTCKVDGQEWVLVSFVAPKGTRQKTDQLGLKVWGSFPTQDMAKTHAQKLNAMKENEYFDIYVLEMYCWAAIPPDPEQIENQEYHDKKLNKLIWAHKVEKEKAREVFDTRTFKLVEDGKRLADAEKNQHNDYQKELVMPSRPLPEFTVIPENDEEDITDLPELDED